MNIQNDRGTITVDDKRIHGYKMSLWISDYNLLHSTKYRPSTVTDEMIMNFVRETANPYLARRNKQ